MCSVIVIGHFPPAVLNQGCRQQSFFSVGRISCQVIRNVQFLLFTSAVVD